MPNARAFRAAGVAVAFVTLVALVPAATAQPLAWEKLRLDCLHSGRAVTAAPDAALYASVHIRGFPTGEGEACWPPYSGLLRLAPGADTWEQVPGPDTSYPRHLIVTLAGDLVAGDGATHRSADGGQTWAQVYPRAEPLSRLDAGPHAGVLFMGQDGFNRANVRSADGGLTWAEHALPPDAFGCKAYAALPTAAHPARVVGACACGLAVSDDGGETFRASSLWAPGVHVGHSLARLPGGGMLAMVGGGCCAGGVYRSADGEAWSLVFDYGPGEGSGYLAVAGAAAFVVSQRGGVWRSGDGGWTWAWAGRVYDGPDTVLVNSVAVDAEGRLWAGASIGSTASSEANGLWRTVAPVVSAGSGPAGVGEGASLSVHPHPARGAVTFTLSVPASGPVTVAVYDVLGRRVAVVHEGPLASGEHALSVDVSGLAPGAYVVRASGAGFAVSRRVTVLR